MDIMTHDLGALFAQLGLDSDPASIDAFIAKNYPLPDDVKVSQAHFWSENQKRFLKEEMLIDAQWAPAVDELNARLHQSQLAQ